MPGPRRASLRAMYCLSVPFSDDAWAALHREFGDAVRVQGLWATHVHLFHPDDFLAVFEAEGGAPHSPNATPFYGRFKDTYDLPEGLCEETGPEWQRLHDGLLAGWSDTPEAQDERYGAITSTLPEFFYLLEALITRNDSRTFVQRQLLRQVQVFVLEAMVAAMMGVRLGGLQTPNDAARYRRYHAVDDFEPRNYAAATGFVDAVFVQSGSQKQALVHHELSPHGRALLLGEYCTHWGHLHRVTRSLVTFAQQRACPFHRPRLQGIGRRALLLPATKTEVPLHRLQYTAAAAAAGAGDGGGGADAGAHGDPAGGAFIRSLLQNPALSLEETSVLCAEMLAASVEKVGWTAYWLLTDLAILGEHQERCREEVFAVLGERLEPTLEDLDRLPHLRACLLESQRRHLLHQRLWRRLAVDVTVGGYLVPKHTDLFLHIGEAVYDDRFLDRPDLFLPDRWRGIHRDLERGVNRPLGPRIPGAPASRLHPAAFLPFGAGARECPGMEMSEHLVLALAAGFLRRYELHWPAAHQSDQSYAHDTGMYLMPHDVDFLRPISVYRLQFKPAALLQTEREELERLEAAGSTPAPARALAPGPAPAPPPPTDP